MHVGLGPRLPTVLEVIPRSWVNTPGTNRTATSSIRRLAGRNPTRGVYMTCMAMWRSGCSTRYEPSLTALAGLGGDNTWAKQRTPYPQTAKGGSWDDTAQKLRSAARRGSDKSWKMQDPQLPKSIWYLTDAQFLGFRVVRPLKVPTPEEMQRYWNNGTERE